MGGILGASVRLLARARQMSIGCVSEKNFIVSTTIYVADRTDYLTWWWCGIRKPGPTCFVNQTDPSVCGRRYPFRRFSLVSIMKCLSLAFEAFCLVVTGGPSVVTETASSSRRSWEYRTENGAVVQHTHQPPSAPATRTT